MMGINGKCSQIGNETKTSQRLKNNKHQSRYAKTGASKDLLFVICYLLFVILFFEICL